MDINLTLDIAAALTEHARREGTTPEQLALAALRERFVVPTPPNGAGEGQATLADYLADHLGVLSSGEHVGAPGAPAGPGEPEYLAQGPDRRTLARAAPVRHAPPAGPGQRGRPRRRPGAVRRPALGPAYGRRQRPRPSA